MPTYQYQCTECGEGLEAVQKFTDEPLTECPNCGGRLRKVFNSVGIVFKGSGFYRTDSRSGSSASTAASPSNGSKDAKESKGASSSSSESSSSSASSSSSSDAGKASSAKSEKKSAPAA